MPPLGDGKLCPLRYSLECAGAPRALRPHDAVPRAHGPSCSINRASSPVLNNSRVMKPSKTLRPALVKRVTRLGIDPACVVIVFICVTSAVRLWQSCIRTTCESRRRSGTQRPALLQLAADQLSLQTIAPTRTPRTGRTFDAPRNAAANPIRDCRAPIRYCAPLQPCCMRSLRGWESESDDSSIASHRTP